MGEGFRSLYLIREQVPKFMTGVLSSIAGGLNIKEYRDWLVFVQRLEDSVRVGRVRSIPVIKRVWSDNEQWFLDPESDEVYVYVAPNPPVLPIWEKLDVLKDLETVDPAPLSVFKVGQITPMMAHVMKINLQSLVQRGSIEELSLPSHLHIPKETSEKWYRDRISNVVYRLREHYSMEGADDIRWEIVRPTEVSGKVN